VKEAAARKVAIAYDTRRFSREFALEAALVLAANGVKAYLFDGERPTPQLSFTIRALGCAAGIVVTASHNPPQYNGYKVYGPDGGQAVSPLVDELSESIRAVHIFRDVKCISREEALAKGLLTRVVDDEEVERETLATVGRIVKGAPLVARWHKQWVHRLMDGRPLSADEKRAAFDFLATDDYREGLDAFLGKRSPAFKGR